MHVTADADLELLLGRAAHLMNRRLAGLLAEHGRTVEEWRVLMLLARDDGQSMSRIAAFSMLPAPTLTKLIDRMVAANLVHRRGDDRDRRRVLVHLTQRGRTTFGRLNALVQAEQARRDAAIGCVVDPTVLARLLSDLLPHLD